MGGAFQEGRGWEGVCGELVNLGGGGGLNIFSGPKRPPSYIEAKIIADPENISRNELPIFH